MCKKDYNEHMAQSLKVVSLRFDYFSMPNFKIQFVTFLQSAFNGKVHFEEKLLGDTDMSMIDTDTVAYNLDTTIEDVTSRKCYLFKGEIDNRSLTIYVHPLFLFMNFKDFSPEGINQGLDSVEGLVNSLQFKNNVNLGDITLSISHNINCLRDHVLEYIDSDAFPSIDFNNKEYKSGRYAEQLKKEDSTILLIRNISFDENDTAHIDIQTQASPDDMNLELFTKTTHSMLEESLKEIAKCLK